jgi:hypothetical protein
MTLRIIRKQAGKRGPKNIISLEKSACYQVFGNHGRVEIEKLA